MRPREYSRWVDPTPLEVELPRLPWWTMLPRKLLVAASPIIALVLLGWLVVFTARKLWRYPLALTSTTVTVALGVGWSWWVPVAVFGGIGAGLGLWAWAHRDSHPPDPGRCLARPGFGQAATRPGTLGVRGASGGAGALLRDRSCRVRADRPRRIWRDFLHTDPLARPLPCPPYPPAAAVPVLRAGLGCQAAGEGAPVLCGRQMLRPCAQPGPGGTGSRPGASPRRPLSWPRSGSTGCMPCSRSLSRSACDAARRSGCAGRTST
jgi:hypothetical protein